MDDNEQVGDNGVAIKEAHEGSANDDIIVEFGGEQRYPTKKQRELGNGGRTTFCLKVIRYMPMWQCVKLL
jgi:hypothetical protein